MLCGPALRQGTLSDAPIRLSVCLSHAPKSKLVQFRAIVTIEHYKTPCCKSNPLVSLSPKTGGSISFRRRWGDIALFSPPGCGPTSVSNLFVFNDSCQTSYLKVHRTDLHQIFRIESNMPADDQSEISFSTLYGTLPRQPNFVVLAF